MNSDSVNGMNKKWILILMILQITLPAVFSADVGVLVEFPDSSIITNCVHVEDNTDGYETMEETGFELDWTDSSPYGQMICRINSIGTDVQGTTCEYNGEYWGFYIGKSEEWSYSPVGFNGNSGCWNRDFFSYGGHYCARDKDVLAFKFGEYGTIPTFYNYDELCNKLQIDKVKVEVDGDKESGIDEYGGKIDVKPGSEIDVEFRITNIYDERIENIEIFDIEVDAEIDDLDDSDLEFSEEFNLDADENNRLDFNFEIPYDAEEDDYELIVEIEGVDEKNIKHNREMNFIVQVDRKNHDVEISSFDIIPDKASCEEKIKPRIVILNLGEKREDITLKIAVPDLEVYLSDSFELETGKTEKEMSFKTHKNIIKGNYVVNAIIEYQDIQLEESAYFEITGCEDDDSDQLMEESFAEETISAKSSLNDNQNLLNGQIRYAGVESQPLTQNKNEKPITKLKSALIIAILLLLALITCLFALIRVKKHQD